MTAGGEILIQTARSALQARDWRRAADLLGRVPAADLSVSVLLDKALAQRMSGDPAGAIVALDAALVLEPKHFVALLSKGALLQRLGSRSEAAGVYRNALAIAPPDDLLPPELATALGQAKRCVSDYAHGLAEHLRHSVAPIVAGIDPSRRERFEECLEIFAGLARPYVAQPLLLNFPRLPAIPFFDRGLFPWLVELEAATAIIQGELANLQDTELDGFVPYIAYPPGVPVNQWGELNHSRRWSSFFLWRDGVRQDEACRLCPRTAAVLAALPMADQPGFAPTAMFSVLDARTTIPPHTGSANSRAIVHLPLVLPGEARFRVGNATRPWRLGEAWVFDDTIEHEAWNDADKARTILIFDVWNPFLSEDERKLVSAMMTAKNAFVA